MTDIDMPCGRCRHGTYRAKTIVLWRHHAGVIDHERERRGERVDIRSLDGSTRIVDTIDGLEKSGWRQLLPARDVAVCDRCDIVRLPRDLQYLVAS